jgi:hypothetical protein
VPVEEVTEDLQEVEGGADALVIHEDRLPQHQFILEGIDTSREPHYTVSEVAKFFFARTAHWIRWRESKGFFVLNGEPIATNRKDKARFYTLEDVEKMAYALAEQKAINGAQMSNVLLLVQTEAKVWGYL